MNRDEALARLAELGLPTLADDIREDSTLRLGDALHSIWLAEFSEHEYAERNEAIRLVQTLGLCR